MCPILIHFDQLQKYHEHFSLHETKKWPKTEPENSIMQNEQKPWISGFLVSFSWNPSIKTFLSKSALEIWSNKVKRVDYKRFSWTRGEPLAWMKLRKFMVCAFTTWKTRSCKCGLCFHLGRLCWAIADEIPWRMMNSDQCIIFSKQSTVKTQKVLLSCLYNLSKVEEFLYFQKWEQLSTSFKRSWWIFQVSGSTLCF